MEKKQTIKDGNNASTRRSKSGRGKLGRRRRLVAGIVLALMTLLFLDVSGTLQKPLHVLAHIQFVPALLAGNLIIVAVLVLITLYFGRVYCSYICPLGIMQDVFGRLGRRKKKYRYTYSAAKTVLRTVVFALFALSLIFGISAITTLLEPYSAFGRIASNILRPVYMAGNNVLAYFAEQADSYMFSASDIWIKSFLVLGVAVVTLLAIAILAWRNGRTYCNTICPVGTLLGFLSKYAWLKPVIDTSKCNSCGLCGRNCKASCIDSKNHKIDYSRCVVCMDCIETCTHGAISYKHESKKLQNGAPNDSNSKPDAGRRSFIAIATMATATAALAQEKKKVDGGLAVIEDKIAPKRATPLTPPGSISAQNMARKCTACQLCVSACPNDVLRPSTHLATFMQPEMSFEHGYCRPECTKCGKVCPAGAIKPIKKEEKSAIQIGHAVVIRKNCVPLTDGVECGNCARHCPTGAILMVPSDPNNPESVKVPVVNSAVCIGCGACENLCPARPFSAIYVEGHEVHREI